MNAPKRLFTRQEAEQFLAMNRNEFIKDAKPYLTGIVRGKQKIVYCHFELCALADKIKAASGRPAKKEIQTWDNQNRQDSPKSVVSGTLIRSSKATDFAKAAKRIRSKKQ